MFFNIVLPEADGRDGEVLDGDDSVLLPTAAPDDNHHIIRNDHLVAWAMLEDLRGRWI